MRLYFLFAVLVFIGAGCTLTNVDTLQTDDELAIAATAVLPVDGYIARRTFKVFGGYYADRFTGWHVGDDIEFGDIVEEVPVVAIMDGTVVRVEFVSGYGGVALIDHGDVNAIYGHIDLSSALLKVGDTVTTGQFIANLGDGYSSETDGERKHLHFGLYDGEPIRVNGYEAYASGVDSWMNPQDWFRSHGVDMDTLSQAFDATHQGGDIFHLEFSIPENMEVEYIPSIASLNIFTLDGEGTARARSQFLIRYFDASNFLTLSTVTVHTTEELTVGKGGYVARRYDIEKRPGVADFVDQPSWRNARHIVTDFTAAEGYGRYYVIAANPIIDPALYEDLLASMRVAE